MEAAVVVRMLPLPEFHLELVEGPESHPALEFFLVGPMAALDLPVALGAAARNIPMGDSEVVEVPREVGSEVVAVVGLDSLDGHRKAAPQLLHEVNGGLDRLVGVCLQDAITGGLIDGAEVIEASQLAFEELHIDFHRLT